MGTDVASFSDLDPTLVEQQLELLTALLAEYNPSLDLRSGVLRSLLLVPGAMFAAKHQTELTNMSDALSLQRLVENPSLVSDDLVDAVLYNHGVVRSAGSFAGGTVTIQLNALQPVTIAAGTLFEANGLQFTTAASFSARTSVDNVVSDQDRVLQELSDGNYSFTIELVAASVGSSYMLLRGTELSVIPQPSYFVKAYVTSDFSDGRDEETNTDLIARLSDGLTVKTCGGRAHMSAAIRDASAFPQILSDSILGMGDAGMLRDQHSLMPCSVGGCTDWYVRTRIRPLSTMLAKTATYVGRASDGSGGLWQFSIDREEAPGFYYASRIVASGSTDSGTFAVYSDVRGTDISALESGGLLPDIATALESTYSRFQTAVIQFVDSTTPTASLTPYVSTQDYDVTVERMPDIAAIQDWASRRSFLNGAGDILIKAPIPCFLHMSFTIELSPGQTTPDVAAIRSDLAAYIHNLGFTNVLSTSALTDVIHAYLSSPAHVRALELLAVIRKPNGELQYTATTDVLELPADDDNMSSGRTIALFISEDDIAISVRTANMIEV